MLDNPDTLSGSPSSHRGLPCRESISALTKGTKRTSFPLQELNVVHMAQNGHNMVSVMEKYKISDQITFHSLRYRATSHA